MNLNDALARGYLNVKPPTPQIIEVDRTIVLGDGDETKTCASFGLRLVGNGHGPNAAEMSPWGGATLLRWVGPAVDASGKPSVVVKVAGPVAACEVGGFTIDCNGVAGVGLELQHPMESRIHDILIANPGKIGVWMHGVRTGGGATVATVAMNCCWNWIERVSVFVQAAGTVGWEVGVGDDTKTWGVSRNVFMQCAVQGTGVVGQVGWRLRGCDSNYWVFRESFDCETPLLMDTPMDATYPGQFPYANHGVMDYLWPPVKNPWLPAVRWAKGWNPWNVGAVFENPIQESAGKGVDGKELYYPAVVEVEGNERALIWQGVREKGKEG